MFGFGKSKRQPNILVYALSAIVDGAAKSAPLGFMPRFSDAYEKRIRAQHQPKKSSFVNDTIAGTAVILFWGDSGIDAVNFLSADEARTSPGFTAIPDDDLAKFDSVFTHFPR
jgi:hypothetical protein